MIVSSPDTPSDRDRVLAMCGEVYTPEGVTIWMGARNAMLDGRTPDELLEAGESDRVLALLDMLASGGFA